MDGPQPQQAMITKSDLNEAISYVNGEQPKPERFTVHRSDRGGLWEVWDAQGGRVSIWTCKEDANHMCRLYNREIAAKARWDK